MNILAVIIAYLLGSIPFGYIVSKYWKGINILEHGSGNIGFTNVLRTIGWPPAAVVLIGDIGKGAMAAWIGLMISQPFGIFCGIAAMLGHSYSIFLKFRGGKLVATSLGVLLVLTPETAVLALIIWLITLGVTRYVSLASILAGIGVIPAMFYFKEPDAIKFFLAVAVAFVIFRHRDNIGRLINGSEYKIGQKAERK